MYATRTEVPKSKRVCKTAKTTKGLNATLAATLVGRTTSRIAITVIRIGIGITPIRLLV